MKNDRPRMNNKATLYLLSVALVAMLNPATVNTTHADTPKDTHYIDVGFFDIHVCNWPNRKLFFMSLFSTPRYDEIQKIDVMDPDGQPLVQLDLTRYKVIKQEKKPEKHVFMKQLDVPEASKNGRCQPEESGYDRRPFKELK